MTNWQERLAEHRHDAKALETLYRHAEKQGETEAFFAALASPEQNEVPSESVLVQAPEEKLGSGELIQRFRMIKPWLTLGIGAGIGVLLKLWMDQDWAITGLLIPLIGLVIMVSGWHLFLALYLPGDRASLVSAGAWGGWILLAVLLLVSPFLPEQQEAPALFLLSLLALVSVGITLYHADTRNYGKLHQTLPLLWDKLVEAFFTGAFLSLIVGFLVGLGTGLLALLEINLGGEFYAWLAALCAGIIPLWALSMQLTAEQPLCLQSSAFQSPNLLSRIAHGTLTIVVVFLTGYLLLLAPSRFDRIFDTGMTTGLFTGMALVLQVLLYVALPQLRRQLDQKASLWHSILLALTLTQAIVLLAVGVQALLLRIGQYALTPDRIMGLILLSAGLLLQLALAYFLFLALRRKSLNFFFDRVGMWQLLGLAGTTLLTVLVLTLANLQAPAINSQLNRARTSEDIRVHLDREFFAPLSPKIAERLSREFENGSTQYQADLVLTLGGMALHWERPNAERDQIHALLDQLPTENDTLQTLIDLTGAENPYTSRIYGPPVTITVKPNTSSEAYESATCADLIMELLDADYQESREFCYGPLGYY